MTPPGWRRPHDHADPLAAARGCVTGLLLAIALVAIIAVVAWAGWRAVADVGHHDPAEPRRATLQEHP